MELLGQLSPRVGMFMYILRTPRTRAPDKVRIFISKTSISAPNPMYDHLLESSHRDDSNKWSNIGFGQEIKELALIVIHFTHLIWHSEEQQSKPSKAFTP